MSLRAIDGWLDWTVHHDLTGSRGNGPFHGRCLGVILHVNVDEHGTSDAFFAAGTSINPDSVTPNFQVYKDGATHQYLPLDWQPWCQADGNYHYAAIETAGMPDEPLTDAQLAACGRIMAAYHAQLDVPLTIANQPGQRGLGIHSMGGQAWGGHSCPGTIRAHQRPQILNIAKGGDDMTPDQCREVVRDELNKFFTGDDGKAHQLRTIVDQELADVLNPARLAAEVAKRLPDLPADRIKAAVAEAIDGATIQTGD